MQVECTTFFTEVRNFLRPHLSAAGFKRRESYWYRYDSTILQAIELGYRREALTIQLGFSLRRLDDSTHPYIQDCQVRTYLQRLFPSWDEEYARARQHQSDGLEVERSARIFWDRLNRYALPLFNSIHSENDLRKLIRSEHGNLFVVEKALRDDWE